MKKRAPKKREQPYHHGDLRNALLESARAILEQKGLKALTLRAVARKARVSHTAPYRHFPKLDALLVELSKEGFAELRDGIAYAVPAPGAASERITAIGAAYMRFVAQRPALARLMFGTQFANRENYPELQTAADSIGVEISRAVGDMALGYAVWAAAHGLAMLALENVIDLGQQRSGLNVLPTRAEIILRSLLTIGS